MRTAITWMAGNRVAANLLMVMVIVAVMRVPQPIYARALQASPPPGGRGPSSKHG